VSGSVTNAVSASIGGVRIYGGPGTIRNDGTIKSTGTQDAVYLNNGGSFTNAASGSIIGGKVGVEFLEHGSPTPANQLLLNDGRISGGSAGVNVQLSSITNAPSASITGITAGVYLYGGTS
jgi:hypothetical protein